MRAVQAQKRLLIAATGFMGLAALLFAFQNCAPMVDPSASEGSSYMKINSLQPSTSTYPFDISFDQLAYLSCSEMGNNLDSQMFWTFKIGAYGDESGIRLSDQLRSDAKGFTSTELQNSLIDSPVTGGSLMQFAVRQRSDKQIVFEGGNPSQGYDYQNFFNDSSLDSTQITQQLIQTPANKRVNYFNGVPGLRGQLMEAQIAFGQSESLQDSVRQFLSGQSLLAVSYGSIGSDETLPRRPLGATASQVYGKGFLVNFAVKTNTSAGSPGYASGQPRVLNSVSEIDLMTNRSDTNGSWICPQELRFRVVRPQDIGTSVNCGSYLTGGDVIASGTEHIYEAVARVMPPSQWVIDTQNRCVIPRNGGGRDIASACYGDIKDLKINYSGGNCSNDVKNYCPHFVSICLK